MEKIIDTDYLFLTTRVRTLENSLLSRDRMTRMLEARTATEAAGVLIECGYPEISPLNINTLQEALAAEQRRTYHDLYSLAPNPALFDVFRVRYDYHNGKVLLKGAAVGTDATHLLLDMGRIPVRELKETFLSGDFRGLPAAFQEAVIRAKEILHTEEDPQKTDFVLDRACYSEMLHMAGQLGSAFLLGYVRISIDAANLRAAVRTLRIGKDADFLKEILFEGGNVSVQRVLDGVSPGGSLADIFARSSLREAAEAGMGAVAGDRMTKFEKLCDDSVNDYLKRAKLVSFGEAPVIAYLAAKENELTAVRIILTGRMADLPAEMIQERLRDAYV